MKPVITIPEPRAKRYTVNPVQNAEAIILLEMAPVRFARIAELPQDAANYLTKIEKLPLL